MKRFISLMLSATFFFVAGCFYPTIEIQNSQDTIQSSANSSIEVDEFLSTNQEITFREMDWGVDSKTATEFLECEEGAYVFAAQEIAIPMPQKSFDLLFPRNIQGSAGTMLSVGGITAGGYDLLECRLYFNYESDGERINRDSDSFYLAVYSIDCINPENVYLSLQEKLTELYGVCKEDSWDSKSYMLSEDYSGTYTTIVKESIWTGANNTFVSLRGESSENENAWIGVWLTYGNLDAEIDIINLQNAIKKEAEKLEEQTNSADNNSGL